MVSMMDFDQTSDLLGFQGALDGLLPYLIVFSMKPSVLAFSISVRTFVRSRPEGTSASISSFRVTSLPGRVVSLLYDGLDDLMDIPCRPFR